MGQHVAAQIQLPLPHSDEAEFRCCAMISPNTHLLCEVFRSPRSGGFVPRVRASAQAQEGGYGRRLASFSRDLPAIPILRLQAAR